MNHQPAIDALNEEITALTSARDALVRISGQTQTPGTVSVKASRGTITPEGRRKLAAAMKRRWRERKAAAPK